MKKILVLGDIFALAMTTIIGFATHRETDLSFLPRFLAIYIPLIVAWLLIASWLRLFQLEIASDMKQLWRVLLAMIIVAPLAVAVRTLILSTSFTPIFAVVVGATSAFGVTIWRGIWCHVS